MILQILFCLLIVLYWFSEGVTEGWTWSTKREKKPINLFTQTINQMVYLIIICGEY